MDIFEYEIGQQKFRCIREDKKKRSSIYFQTWVVPEGYINMQGSRYRFNNVSGIYQSKYISWLNQLHCGGWMVPQDYLYHAVQQGKKLYAGFSFYQDVPQDQQVLSEIESNLPDDCVFGKETSSNTNCVNYFVCKRGCIADYICLSDVFASYEKLGYPLLNDQKTEIEGLCALQLDSFSSADNMDYANPVTLADNLTTGLLLGYPLEATVSCLGL